MRTGWPAHGPGRRLTLTRLALGMATPANSGGPDARLRAAPALPPGEDGRHQSWEVGRGHDLHSFRAERERRVGEIGGGAEEERW